MRRIVVTGMGCMTSLGNDVPAFREGLMAGRSGIAADDLGSFAALPAWAAADHFTPRQAPKLDPYSQIALIAARQAVAQAGFAAAPLPNTRIAVVVGSAMAGKTTDDDNYRRLWGAVAEGRQAASHPLAIPRYIGNAAASQIGMEFGFQGPTFSLSSSCASGAQAVGLALWLVRSGAADAALAGGSDIASSPSVRCAWDSLGLAPPVVLGDGAGMVIIEAAEIAAKRGATPLAEVAGFGTSMQGRAAPAEAMEASMRAALADAGISADSIDHIEAHGINAEETTALGVVFPAQPPRSMIKAAIGHSLGASGVLGLIATVESMRRRAITAALVNCFAFGGLNAALVLKPTHQGSLT